MAFIYKRHDSPFWWIKFKRDGKWVQETTGLRHASNLDTKQARQLRLERALEEAKTNVGSPKECYAAWAHDYLHERYKSSPKTLNRYRGSLRVLLVFLTLRKLLSPRQLRYGDLLEFIRWRQQEGDPDQGIFKASSNTTRGDLAVLRIIMDEAVRRGFTSANPCKSLGLKREKPAEKPAMTDAEVVKIRKELKKKKWPDWMSVAFEIAIRQGCRLRETSLPMRDIDLGRVKPTITFNAKGGKRFTTALHPELIPMIKKWQAEGREKTCEMPLMPSKYWWQLFKKLKMRHLCFHCTRVTVITRLARGEVPISKAMRFVGHASETIHRVYQRLTADDLDPCLKALTNSPAP